MALLTVFHPASHCTAHPASPLKPFQRSQNLHQTRRRCSPIIDVRIALLLSEPHCFRDIASCDIAAPSASFRSWHDLIRGFSDDFARNISDDHLVIQAFSGRWDVECEPAMLLTLRGRKSVNSGATCSHNCTGAHVSDTKRRVDLLEYGISPTYREPAQYPNEPTP